MVGSVGFAQDPGADIVILGGRVWTGLSDQPSESAIAIVGNKIMAVDNEVEIKKWIRHHTKVIAANGKLVLPGFNDSHVHFMAIGNLFSSLDAAQTTSATDLYSELRHFARFLPKGRWIIGSGGSEELWKEVEANELDKAAPDNPIFLYHADAQSAIVNSLAIKEGRVNHEVAGVVRGQPFEILRRAVPADHSRNWSQIAETASNYAASFGVTSVQDMHSDAMADVYRKLQLDGKLKTRVYDCVSITEWAKTKAPFRQVDAEAMVRTGCLKGFHEGDDDWTPKLRADVLAADKAGWQVAVHAIGPKSSRIAIDIFEAAAKANGPRDRRFRLEHAEGIPPEDIPRLTKYGILPSVQPYLFGGGRGYRSGYYASLLKDGGRLALGSDAPMTSFDPLLGLLGAIPPEGGLALGSAIKGYTAGSAFAEFADEKKGTLAPGQLADIVILSQNIFVSTNLRAEQLKVEFTITNGNIVYTRNNTEK